ncbi:MAG: hypothetical protein WC861_02970 [Candidatus Micrarchaeia archaeon]|jgi:uncharacterized membrane protein (GlpM family)
MDIFYIKLLLSFLVGGAYIAFTIWLSERFGSKIGGIAIGLPTTTIISLIFIAWTSDLSAAVAAVPIMPLVTAACTLFVAAFVHFYGVGRNRALAIALLAWALLTFPFVLLGADNILLSLLVAAVFFAIAVSYLGKFPHRKLPGIRLTKAEFLFRCIFAGAIVATAVLLSKTLGPVWGGLFAAFPAAYSSSLYLLSKKHGIGFTASVAASMPFGSIANVVFEVAFYCLALSLGLWGGLAAAYALSLVAAVLLYRFFMK